ncbi:hypothetical protein K443DRAFT_681004 [Laccaria amethystina LaAM-08-1]|jgi:hypothetical protein|uniref:Uncharacterized protein n=1 Tax=Laccaria amethystina LaAM-08-1 TaxID=1095629 RepID=A0A0C9XKL1_9AGAR|nr:hypothetical protein K443DRAFT_681004 [Laccaria amethystina LaAM-08-1]
MDFYDLYENLRLTRPPSPLIDEVSSDEESLADEDLDEKRQARYSTSTVKGFVVERVNASETSKEASDSESDGSPQGGRTVILPRTRSEPLKAPHAA